MTTPEPYTPTLGEIRALFDERTEEGAFDRWLAAHDREVAERAVEALPVQWGVKHSQGIRWESSESAARSEMAAMVAYDKRRQRAVQGMVRLVKRYQSEPIEAENPYTQGAAE